MDREEVPMSMSRNDSTSMKESEVDPTTNDDKPTNQTNNLNSMTAPTHIQSTKKLDKMSRFIQNRDQNPAQTTSRDSSSHTRSHRTPNGLNRNAYDYILDTRVYKKKKRGKTQVGTEMHALTVKNVALGTMIAIMLTTIFTNHERGTYMNSSMLTMHGTLTSVKNITKGDNKTDEYLNKTFNMVNLEDEFNLISYKIGNNSLLIATDDSLREREMLEIIISCDPAYVPEDEKSCVDYEVSVGVFDARFWFTQLAIYTILLLIFIMITWYIAVSSFAGPITVLIIIPIERMIKILNLLVADPFGYQRSQKYRHFIEEGEDIDICSKWKKLNLSGMETSFLMSTILRIGSLMKVGFGDAGAKIIRQSLENEKNGTGENSDRRKKTSKTNVSCIFLFCDIRRFTDATECLREEVFVFTNKIAAVVHSLCHSYGGSANKNIGDAFLISWLLEENETRAKGKGRRQNKAKTKTLVAKHDEADKALLAVLKIIIALNYESYFLDELSAGTRERLKEKFFHTEGPLVQMGFGLHAGKAVQGAIGSHRKLDATYISNAVEQAEYLESSTKKYGVKLLMSGEFYGMLTPGNRRRCRQIDQVFFRDDDGDQFEEPPNPEDYDEKMELYTYDIDVNFIFQNSNKVVKSSTSSLCGMSLIEKNSVDRGSLISTDVYQMTVAMGLSASQRAAPVHSITSQMPRDRDSRGRRWSMNIWTNLNASVNSKSMDRVLGENLCAEIENGVENVEYVEGELLLPTEKCIYKPSIWLSDDMRFVRGRYSDGQFFQEFNIGLQHYFHGEWDAARECLQAVDAKITDGPARYYLKKMQDTNYVPPRGFTGWSEA